LELNGACVLVTGASGGLGPAISRACADRGCHLVLTGRNDVSLRALADELRADVIVADLTDDADVTRLVDVTAHVDVLVSNAALPGGGQVATFSVEEIDRLLDVNLRAPIMLSRCLAAHMTRRRHGHLVFVSSLAAAFPTPGLTLYNATKCALDSYALSLRGELTEAGVGVSIIHLGPIRDAGMWADTGLSPMGLRTKAPADVGNAVVRAVERNLAQVSVAPFGLRLGARLSRVTPGTFARVAPKLGARRITDSMADALRHKR
jgi:short-subunit dehydrogenase